MENRICSCDVVFQRAVRQTGQNLSSNGYTGVQIYQHRKKLVLIAPGLKKALNFQKDCIRIYSKYMHMGKLTLVFDRSNETHQLNFSNGSLANMRQIKTFAIQFGGVHSSTKSSNAENLGVKRKIRSPIFKPMLRDRTNEPIKPNTLVHQNKKRVRGLMASPTKTKSNRVLTAKQQQVLDAIQQGRNVFFTGSAGSGKSFLIKKILTLYAQEKRQKGIFLTATTAIAAHHIGGITIHHFAGITAETCSVDELARRCSRNKDVYRRWREAKLLVIDEVSMLSGELLDTLNGLAKALRGNETPFGGLQLVLCGDFFQLPPISRNDCAKFCFDSAGWKECIDVCIQLDRVFRQKDAAFAAMLNEIRMGKCSDNITDLKASTNGSFQKTTDSEDAIEIFTHNADVVKTNNRKLKELVGDDITYTAVDRGNKEVLKGLLALSTLVLREGAQVCLLKTLSVSRGLVNGARGIVRGFTKQGNLPIVHFSRQDSRVVINREEWVIQAGGRPIAIRKQIPLCLAWAISIHKSQGMTLHAAKINLSRTFEFGQAYVALSRLRSIEGLEILGAVHRQLIRAHPKVIEFHGTLEH